MLQLDPHQTEYLGHPGGVGESIPVQTEPWQSKISTLHSHRYAYSQTPAAAKEEDHPEINLMKNTDSWIL